MNWNPMMGPLGAMQDNPLAAALGNLQKNTLGGGGVTLGNEQAQQDYAQQMAQALAQQQSAAQQGALAESMMAPQYAKDSGGLGSLAMILQAYAGKKMAKRAAADDASARERYYKGESGAKAEQEARDAQRKRDEDAAEQRQREELAKRYGLQGRDQMRYVLEGKVGEGVRGVPTMTDQGLVNVNPYTGEGVPVSIGGQQQDVRIDPALAGNPEAMAAIRQDMANGAPAGDQNYQVQARRPLMPYRDPAEAQRQAAAEARANAQLGLAYRAADRADESLKVQREAARNKPTTEDQNKSAGYAMRMERALESISKSAQTNPEANRPGFGIAALDMLPESVGNYLKPAERQNIEAAQLDALDAALTLNTGAAYTKEQLYSLRKSYFPQPGDDETTIAGKQERLNGLIDTARVRARGAYPDKSQQPAAGGWGIREVK